MILFVQYRPGCKLQPNNNNDVHNSNFLIFSNDILSSRIDTKAVTEKNGQKFEFKFKFLFNRNFGPWAFRNCAYFVTKPPECDTARLRVQLNPYYGRRQPPWCSCTRFRQIRLSATTYGPLVQFFFVQKPMLGGGGLVQTARSTLAPTMGVTERKK